MEFVLVKYISNFFRYNFSMKLQKILVELRKERGLSQKAVADSIGISQSTIAKIEVDRNEATASTLRKLADFFGVSADYLLGRTEEYGGIVGVASSQLTDEEEELLRLFRKLPDEYRSHELESLRLFAREPMKTALPKKA